jgi:hypothetical protein
MVTPAGWAQGSECPPQCGGRENSKQATGQLQTQVPIAASLSCIIGEGGSARMEDHQGPQCCEAAQSGFRRMLSTKRAHAPTAHWVCSRARPCRQHCEVWQTWVHPQTKRARGAFKQTCLRNMHRTAQCHGSAAERTLENFLHLGRLPFVQACIKQVLHSGTPQAGLVDPAPVDQLLQLLVGVVHNRGLAQPRAQDLAQACRSSWLGRCHATAPARHSQ